MDLARFQASSIAPLVRAASVRWFTLRKADLLVIRENGTLRLPRGAHPPLSSTSVMYLGKLDGVDCFAQSPADSAEPPAGGEFAPLRSLFEVLEPAEFALAGRAMHLLEWDAFSRFCGRCGGAARDVLSERAKECERCKSVVYPRISPAVIGVVERDGKILLARHVRSPRPIYTSLAGFVEPGESLEEAFRREVFEEVGIWIRDVRYFGSQPWAFSSSLMVGFTARYEAGELKLDPAEIQDAQWFPPDALPELPGKLSISRALIDSFVSAQAPQR